MGIKRTDEVTNKREKGEGEGLVITFDISKIDKEMCIFIPLLVRGVVSTSGSVSGVGSPPSSSSYDKGMYHEIYEDEERDLYVPKVIDWIKNKNKK